jgi:DNA primase large subunit
MALGTMKSKLVTITPLLNMLSSLNSDGDYKVDTTKRSGKVQLSEIEMVGSIYSAHSRNKSFKLAKRSYPMCMKNLHWRLKEKHHLKHMGRMQYGLFLKGIGLSLEDALQFWRSEFCKIMVKSDEFFL